LTIYENNDRIFVYFQEEFMPAIRPSADLRNKYNEISDLCHEYREPVFITKNGKGDLAVMSMETYEFLTGKLQLYSLIDAGLEQVKNGKTKPMKESLKKIRENL
jgi:PHD/YefM family antitoxin component YafN of YafNO toxin-antitoxin module